MAYSGAHGGAHSGGGGVGGIGGGGGGSILGPPSATYSGAYSGATQPPSGVQMTGEMTAPRQQGRSWQRPVDTRDPLFAAQFHAYVRVRGV